jgi:hypothetical protein
MDKPKPYTGPDRRAEPSLTDVWDLMTELNAKLESHIIEEGQIRPHLIELVDILQKSKGVVTFFKLLIYIGAPIAAIIAWGKDHIKY